MVTIRLWTALRKVLVRSVTTNDI